MHSSVMFAHKSTPQTAITKLMTEGTVCAMMPADSASLANMLMTQPTIGMMMTATRQKVQMLESPAHADSPAADELKIVTTAQIMSARTIIPSSIDCSSEVSKVCLALENRAWYAQKQTIHHFLHRIQCSARMKSTHTPQFVRNQVWMRQIKWKPPMRTWKEE